MGRLMGTTRLSLAGLAALTVLAACGGTSTPAPSTAATTAPVTGTTSTPQPSSAAPTSGPSLPPSTIAAATDDPNQPQPLLGKVIVIDPGHNGGNGAHPEIINKQVDIVNGRKACNTAGTETNDGYAEHEFTWDVANRLATRLKAMGAKPVLTRPSDSGVGPCITQRAMTATTAKADASISIHADGGPSSGYGFHVIMPGSVGPNDAILAPSKTLALQVRNAFQSATGEPYATYIAQQGLDTRTDLGGLNLATVPSVFIECGNMRNAADADRLKNPAWRQRAAEALATGLSNFLA